MKNRIDSTIYNSRRVIISDDTSKNVFLIELKKCFYHPMERNLWVVTMKIASAVTNKYYKKY